LALALAANLYCPSSNDLQVAYSGGTISIVNQGWTITSGGGVASKSAYNLLGGWISFTANFQGTPTGVNANLYSISPHFSAGTSGSFNKGSDYCDGQGSGSTWCAEIDYIETNGNCGGATTYHTFQGSSGTCGAGGCAASYTYGGTSKFNMNISFSTSGVPTVVRNGGTVSGFSPAPGSGDYSALMNAYKNQGAVLYSSIWTGWVPVSSCGTSGNLNGASFSISNLQVFGTVVQGPSPTLCSGQTTTTTKAPTTTTKPPTSSPSPAGCNFQYSLNGKQCRGLTQKTGVTSQSACQSACCSTSGCQVWQWWSSNSQCWLGKSGTAITTSNCPANSGSFTSSSTVPLKSAAEVSSAQQDFLHTYIWVVVGAVVIAILVIAMVLVLRGRRKRSLSVDTLMQQNQKSIEPMSLQATSSAQDLDVPVQDAPVDTAPLTMEPTASQPPLAEGWELQTNPDNGKAFYYNTNTGVSQWEAPDVTAPEAV